LIRSLEYDQHTIMENIMELNGIDSFDADITYANGGFYKKLPQPKMKFDIDPQTEDTVQASSVDLPVEDGSLSPAKNAQLILYPK